MNNYSILICDDSKSEIQDIQLFLNAIFRESSDIKLELTAVSFDKVNEELSKEYDLLILDLLDATTPADSSKNAGIGVLMRNNVIKQIPTVVYTSTGDALGFDEEQMKAKYPALIKKLTKVHNSYENLVEFVKAFIIGNPINHGHYRLYNENDISLNLSIRLIGDSNFTYILYQIFEDIGKQIITVYPMTSGFSGAVLFKLKYGNKISILKLSNDVVALRKEHENAVKLYNEFPNHMINHIAPKEYSALESKVIGILIKNVEEAKTFFDMIISLQAKTKIEKYLQLLYQDGNSLKDHFSKKRGEKKNWTAIFDQMDERKLAMVEKAHKDLSTIITRYYNDHTIDINDFKNLSIANKYKNLNIEKLIDEKFSKSLVLSHGDFHAKNIMVQNDRPVIIDTGLLCYKYWSLDICRLIANVFIMGIDCDNINYYELNSIEKDLVISDLILARQEISFDGVNDNAITALNWLILNVEDIYGDLYTLFEFQLGLMKEFLQIAYRVDSVPPGKRALSLMVAHKCMITANENVNT